MEKAVNNCTPENPVDKRGLYPQVIHRVLPLIHSFYPQEICDGNRGLSHLSTLSTGPITTTILLKYLRTEVKEINRKGKNRKIRGGKVYPNFDPISKLNTKANQSNPETYDPNQNRPINNLDPEPSANQPKKTNKRSVTRRYLLASTSSASPSICRCVLVS